MRVAICSSLQGAPEEFSPATPVDCYRLSGYVYNRLVEMFPDADFDLFNRDNFIGMGDAYVALRNAVVAWGAQVAVHIHQDAGYAPWKGWHVIFTNEAAIGLADELAAAMMPLPSPVHGTGIAQRTGIAVLKRPAITVLVEAGYFTSGEDEAIGIEGWGNAIVKGVSNYLVHHWGLQPGQEEGEEMARFERVERPDLPGEYVYVCAHVTSADILCIAPESAADGDVTVYCLPKNGNNPVSVTKGAGGWNNKAWHGADYKVAELFPGVGEMRLGIHSPVPLALELRK